jgi:FkbM family methyltransferase
VLDVGANMGLYSELLAPAVSDQELFLFEPIPQVALRLRRRFPAAKVIEAALSDHEGEGVLRIPYIDGRLRTTRATTSDHDEPGLTGYEDVRVRFDTLDAVCRAEGIDDVGLLKIDVEGHELEFLRGAREVLARGAPLLLVEIEQRHHPEGVSNVFGLLESYDFEGFYVDPRTLSLRRIAEFDAERDQPYDALARGDFRNYANNFLFVRRGAESEAFESAMVELLDAEASSARPAREGP